MDSRSDNFRQAVYDFHAARQRAALEEVLARMTGKSNQLLSYEEVAQKLKLQARAERGVRSIPLNAIVGSVGRYTDFTRSFLPRNPGDEERWARVKASLDGLTAGWPPIEVYQVGEVYFVLDGNHRVSIARQEGWEKIEARVVEVKTNIPLTLDVSPDDLIVKAEYAEFLDETEIHKLRPQADLSVSVPGQYDKLREYIQVHRYYMGLDFQRDISYEEALTHWYDTVYLPLVEIIRERGLLRWFPGRTETDLYLWLSEHRAALQDELGWELRPEAVADIMDFLSYTGFSAKSYEEGRSFMSGKLEHGLMSEFVTITDDALSEGAMGLTFDYEGCPKYDVPLIDYGVAIKPVTDSYWAEKTGWPNTGHALPAPNPYGPMPLNVTMAPGEHSLDELISAVKRGVYVTRFHYVNVEDPITVMLTGMTRDGTFLIENGRLTRPLKNLRFTQSAVQALWHCEGVTAERRFVGTGEGACLVPGLYTTRFEFTGQTAQRNRRLRAACGRPA